MSELPPCTVAAFRETLEAAVGQARWELVVGELACALADWDEKRPAAERGNPKTFELFEAEALALAATHDVSGAEGWEALRAAALCSPAGDTMRWANGRKVSRAELAALRDGSDTALRQAAVRALETVGGGFVAQAGLRWEASGEFSGTTTMEHISHDKGILGLLGVDALPADTREAIRASVLDAARAAAWGRLREELRLAVREGRLPPPDSTHFVHPAAKLVELEDEGWSEKARAAMPVERRKACELLAEYSLDLAVLSGVCVPSPEHVRTESAAPAEKVINLTAPSLAGRAS